MWLLRDPGVNLPHLTALVYKPQATASSCKRASKVMDLKLKGQTMCPQSTVHNKAPHCDGGMSVCSLRSGRFVILRAGWTCRCTQLCTHCSLARGGLVQVELHMTQNPLWAPRANGCAHFRPTVRHRGTRDEQFSRSSCGKMLKRSRMSRGLQRVRRSRGGWKCT